MLSISQIRTVEVYIYLPVWFVGNRYSIEIDLIRTWRCVDTWIVLTMLISDWDTLSQKNNMKTSKSFVLASEVRTATARGLVQEQTIDWNLCFVCGTDKPKSVQLTKPSARKVRRVSIFLTLVYIMLSPIYRVQQQWHQKIYWMLRFCRNHAWEPCPCQVKINVTSLFLHLQN